MSERFVHVGFMFPGVPKIRDLEPSFYRIGDWVRYSQTCWIVWTGLETYEILRILLGAIDAQDNVFVATISATDFMGKFPPWIWDWIRTKRAEIITDAQQPDLLKALMAPNS